MIFLIYLYLWFKDLSAEELTLRSEDPPDLLSPQPLGDALGRV